MAHSHAAIDWDYRAGNLGGIVGGGNLIAATTSLGSRMRCWARQLRRKSLRDVCRPWLGRQVLRVAA